jgi:hypothetical protein
VGEKIMTIVNWGSAYYDVRKKPLRAKPILRGLAITLLITVWMSIAVIAVIAIRLYAYLPTLP